MFTVLGFFHVYIFICVLGCNPTECETAIAMSYRVKRLIVNMCLFEQFKGERPLAFDCCMCTPAFSSIVQLVEMPGKTVASIKC